MERVRIAVLDAYDHVIAYMDNGAPKALHYHEDELHEYLKGTANTLTFCAGAKHDDAQYLVEGNKLSFLYRGKEYYLNIMKVIRTEPEVEVTAFSLSFELLNEEKEKYAASEAKTFAQYLSIFDTEHVVTIGNNEVSNKSIKHEWGDTDTFLARLFSLANVFEAEIEFIPKMNDNYSLKEIVMNVYKEHTDDVQGIGVKRNDIVLRYGKNVTGITKTADITGLYTAIRPFGRDGLTVTDLAKKEYDADGNLEYYTEAGSNNILAPQARDRFPANLWSAKDRYIAKIYEYDTDNVNVLYGNALAELKKNCVPQVEYDVSGYFDTDIGDTVQIEDEEYNPKLYLEARVTEQIRSFTDSSRNKTTFDNYREIQSQLDSDLVAKMNALIEQNKTYACMISSDNGTTFKNNAGSSVLVASVRDGSVDVTDKFVISWTKDGEALSTGKSITVNASDVNEKSVYRFEAKDTSGIVKGFYEVTVTDVSDGDSPTVTVNEDSSLTITDANGEQTTAPLKGEDGKTSYTHTKYSNDGGKSFTGNLVPTDFTKWASGYYGKNGMTENEKRICYGEMIPVTPSGSYKLKTNYADDTITLGLTQYAEDESYIDVRYAKTAEYTMKVLDTCCFVRPYIRADDAEGFNCEAFAVAFENGEIIPEIYVNDGSAGNGTGSYMGVLTDFNEEASLTTNDYTWNKIKGDPVGVTESDTEPEEPYEGMLWKNTGTIEGKITGATYKWNGAEWELYLFVAENIQAESLSAICAYLGEVHSGKIINEVENADGNNVKALEVLENQINFYDAEGNGAYAGRIAGGHIGNNTSLPIMNIDALNGVVVQVDGNQVANFTEGDLLVNDVAVGAALKNLTDYIKIIEYQTEAVTLDAYGSKAMTIEPETIDGYKYLMSLGGKGNGQAGLIVSSGSAWVFNANNAQKTFTSVSFYLLYIRDI